MNHRVRYRLFHKANGKYVAWPHGRGFVDHTKNSNANDLMPMLRIENAAWGATDILPVLEIHAVSVISGAVRKIFQLSQYDSNAYIYTRDLAKRRAA